MTHEDGTPALVFLGSSFIALFLFYKELRLFSPRRIDRDVCSTDFCHCLDL
jgi:hypothetical protein